SFRLAAWHSCLFVASTLLIFIVAYMMVSSSLERRDRDAIEAKLNEYAAEYQSGGLEGLKQKVIFDSQHMGKTLFVSRVARPDNTTLYLRAPGSWKFDSKQLEHEGIAAKQWTHIPVDDSEDDGDNDTDRLEVAALRLPDHTLLQVGSITEERDDLLERFAAIYAGLVVPFLALGLIGSSFLSFRAFRPIRYLVDSLRSIVATGNLSARVAVDGNSEEVDELSGLFNSLLDKIEALIRGMKSSLDNVAHELRTPMTRLRGVAELALQPEASSQLLRDALANCLEESDRILTMVNTMLDISEAETGAMKLSMESVNVSQLVEQVVELYSYVAEDKKIAISTTVPKELCVTADRNRLLHVLANLMDNAIKYTPDGGKVDLTAVPNREEVVIAVTDNGVGIAADERSKIYDRLYRGDKSRSERGLGLGLSLVKAIAEAHQGYVEVSSEVGHGSQFALHLRAGPLS
ncbi:MAG TPA: HAMP domain-containing sensor histidine kinase, partial [Candidatus Acidoferrales bacterium]|nr:HAMP domain-containing sensor histidine kinase [Candidatus Acidoferrales bacterium]